MIGGNNKTNAFDLGTGDVLVGVNNMGTGVGPNMQVESPADGGIPAAMAQLGVKAPSL